MAHGTVMVVEDDALIRDAVIEILADEGIAAFGAHDGEDALAQLRGERVRPAVILLDLMMPVMNGWEFRAEQLKDPELSRIPVVVMSASDPCGISADRHVRKPFAIPVLVQAVRSLAPALRA